MNSTSNSLDLKNGGVSKSLLAAGGNSLQDECRKNYPMGIQPGQIARTGGGNLKCKCVFHTCLPNWSADQISEQVSCKLRLMMILGLHMLIK